MLSDQQLTHVKRRLIAMQFVALAMFVGSLVFAFLVMSIADWSVIYEPLKLFNYMGGATALLLYCISFGATILLPRLPDKTPSSNEKDASLAEETKAINGILALLTTETVVRYALFQGGIFLNVMVFMLEPRWATLAVAAIGMVLMLVCFPLKFWALPKLSERFDEWKAA